MSTYYGFYCEECKKTGGFFSRQAWGWGNADILESFKFIMKHTESCGEENIRIVSEHNEKWMSEEDEEDFACGLHSSDWIKVAKEIMGDPKNIDILLEFVQSPEIERALKRQGYRRFKPQHYRDMGIVEFEPFEPIKED